MITFGFKDKFGGWLRGISAIVLGLIMIIRPETSLLLIVKILAAFLIASGVVSIIYGIINRQRGGLPLMAVNTVVDIIIGVVLFIYPGAAASILIIVFGIFLVVLGVFQIIVIASAASVVGPGFLFFIFPVLCTVGGTLLLVNPFNSAAVLTLVAGIAVLVYGFSELLSTYRVKKAMKVYEVKFSAPEDDDSNKHDDMSDVKDVDYEKIDD